MANEVAVADPASQAMMTQMGVTPEQVDVVRSTVAKASTDEELAMFFSLARKYELDPFAKEIWCICPTDSDTGQRKMKNGRPEPAQITVSRDGFLAIANRHKAFNGMTSEVVRAKDDFRRHSDGSIEHSYGLERGAIVGAYAIVYRKDRSVPTYFFARWEEYGKPNAVDGQGRVRTWSPWSKYPSAMLKKVAEAMALKQAFSVSGVVTEEELDAGRAIDEGAPTEIQDRPPLRRPQIARGIGMAKTQPRIIEQPPEPPIPPDPDDVDPAQVPEAEGPAGDELPWLPPDPDNPDEQIPFGEGADS